MGTEIQLKQEVFSELASQNEPESFPRNFADKSNNTIIWNDDCAMGIKTEIKQEASVRNCFSQDDIQLCTEVNRVEVDTFKHSNGTVMDTKTELASENVSQFFPIDFVEKMKNCSSYSEIEIKEESWWLKRTTHTLSYSEEIKNEGNAAELPRLNTEVVSQVLALNQVVRDDINLNLRQDSSELQNDSNIRKTFTVEESLSSEHSGQHRDKILSTILTKPNNSFGSDSNKNISCKSEVVKLNFTDSCGNIDTCQLSNLKHHTSYCEAVNIYKCQVCERTFTLRSELKQHNLVHASTKLFTCEICEKTFTLFSSLKRHKLIHEDVKPHKCEICDKSFNQISHLKRHNMIHEGVKPHKCKICEKHFTHLSSFKRHNMIHEGIKPHKCKICESSFTLLGDLKLHNLIHEGVKPHKCEICDKTFTRMSHLKRHNLIHVGVKPHKCEICEKTFTRLSTLKQHYLIHDGIKSHKCDICKKTFTRLLYLKQHNLIHEDVRSHKCELCRKSFRHLSALKRHILGHVKITMHKKSGV